MFFILFFIIAFLRTFSPHCLSPIPWNFNAQIYCISVGAQHPFSGQQTIVIAKNYSQVPLQEPVFSPMHGVETS